MSLFLDALGALRPGGRATTPQLDVLDLRHFTAARLRALLADEAAQWERELDWDYGPAVELLLGYIEDRVLPGFAALAGDRIVGYAFAVIEAEKGIVGDVYAFGETGVTADGEPLPCPVSETLLHHLLEVLEATPGVERVESQLLLYPAGALRSPFGARGYRAFPRVFMTGALADVRPPAGVTLPAGYTLERWRPDLYAAGARLIHRAYAGHVDSGINDQYRSISGSEHFLHNIVRFPGCGVFEPTHSWVLRHMSTSELGAMMLISRIHPTTAHMTQLCLGPELRGDGVGHALVAHCAAQLAAAGMATWSLTVTEANATAMRLYARCGLRATRRFNAWTWEAAW